MTAYFTDREYGARPPTTDAIDGRVWGGLHSLIATRLGNGSFGYRFPEQCQDGNAECGCDERAFQRVLAAEVPWIEWPVSAEEVPETPVILDLLKFCAAAIGEPIEGSPSGVANTAAMAIATAQEPAAERQQAATTAPMAVRHCPPGQLGQGGVVARHHRRAAGQQITRRRQW